MQKMKKIVQKVKQNIYQHILESKQVKWNLLPYHQDYSKW